MYDARAHTHARVHTHARYKHTKVTNEATEVERNGIEKIKVEGEVEVKRNCKWEDGRNGEKETRGEKKEGRKKEGRKREERRGE